MSSESIHTSLTHRSGRAQILPPQRYGERGTRAALRVSAYLLKGRSRTTLREGVPLRCSSTGIYGGRQEL